MSIRVEQGDELRLVYAASAAPTTLTGFILIEDVAGEVSSVEVFYSAFTADRTLQGNTAADSRIIGKTGKIVGASIGGNVTLTRGRVYAMLVVLHRSIVGSDVVCKGYIYPNNPIAMGEFSEALSEQGYLDWVQEADDTAGNATATVNLAATNARRIVRAVLVKYHSSSDVATRTLTITLRDLASATGPTGWSNASDTWISPTLTLTADEEGLIHVGEHGFVSTNDDGTLAYADNSSSPNPFPLAVEEGDAADLIIAAGSGEAADDFDVWVQYEEWLQL